MHAQAKIQKWGNSLGLRLSGHMKSIPCFEEDMIVDVEITKHGIQIKPAHPIGSQKLLFTEAQLLKDLNEYTAHADELSSVLLSREHGF